MSDRYSFSLTTFSPSGKLGQIEHALAAVSAGVTAIGIKAKNGIVIATERKSSTPLLDSTSLEKVTMISKNIGLVYSGMGPDARVLIDKSRKAAQEYKRVYMEEPPVLILVKEVAAIMQDSTQSGGVRPFGVSLLVAGFDSKGPVLYQVDPSGAYFAWKATAIGKNMINAKTFLEKRFNEDMELEDVVHTAILTLKEGYEGSVEEDTLEIGIAYSELEEERGPHVDGLAEKRQLRVGKFRKLTGAEIKDYLANIA